MRLQVIHETAYRYAPVVETAQHMAFLRPVDTFAQNVLDHELTISPTPSHLQHALDAFGNHRSFFALDSAHDALRVVATSELGTRLIPLPASLETWEVCAERFRFVAHTPFDAACEFTYPSPFVPLDGQFKRYAAPSFGRGQTTLEGARDLMGRIYNDLTYDPHSTEINTPALQALTQRRGVCQDFAHIMIACLRALGLSARYVSGYVLTEPVPGQPKMMGADASHAWVQVAVSQDDGSTCWCDFDPTNNRCGCDAPGDAYITLARGRDFSDVSPLRGVIQGGNSHTLRVGVTVTRLDELPANRDNGSNIGAVAAQQGSQVSGQSQSQSQSQGQNGTSNQMGWLSPTGAAGMNEPWHGSQLGDSQYGSGSGSGSGSGQNNF